MARIPKPWWRKDRKSWFVTINGKRYDLGPDREFAWQRFHELMAQSQKRQVASGWVLSVFDAFLEWTKRHRAPRTYDWYRERLQQFASSIPTSLTVAQFKPLHVQNWIDGKSCSDGHKRGCMTAILRAMNWATRMGYIEKNPIAGIEKPAAGKRETIITPEQFDRTISFCHDDEFHDLLTVAWETGARPQELMNVEARHVDLPKSRWVFSKDEAKGKKRVRIVYLTETAFEITKRLMLKWPSGPIFRNARGNPWHRNNVNCRFQRMKKHIGKKLCLYNFRHSFATRLLEEGVDSLMVAALLGHADLSMLGRVYAHLTQNPANLLEQLRRRVG
jgi:integrase